MPPFHPGYEALFRQGPPAPEDFERYLEQLGFPWVARRPGWFRVPPGWRAEWGGLPIPPGREVHFTILDPDKRDLPFHRSAAFAVHPAEFRMDCLFRNPYCVRLSAALIGSAWALASGRAAPGELPRLVRLGHALADRFGLYWSLPFDQHGNLLDEPQPFLFPAFPAAPLYGGPTARGRRGFANALAERRRHHRLVAPRQLSEREYEQMLGLWDAREGWQGPCGGYDPEQAVTLRAAAARTGTRPAAYYNAFRFVTGRPYSAENWLATIGPAWGERQGRGLYKRRGTGRKRSGNSDDPLDRLMRLFQGPAGAEVRRRSLAGEDPVAVLLDLQLPANDMDYLRELLSSSLLRTLLDHLTDR
jgi:hypothetical protein